MDAADRLHRVHLALSGLQDGRLASAEGICRQLVAEDANDVEALLLLGLTYGLQGHAETAAPILNRVAQVRPNYAHPCQDLAQMLRERQQASLIVPQYWACVRLAPNEPRLRYAFAEFLVESGEPVGGVTLLQPVVQACPASAVAHYQLGLALAEAGQFGAATEHFHQAIAINPAAAAFWANLGMMLKVEGRFEAALEAYEQALARAPEDARIRVNRAVARLHAGQFAEAWQDTEWHLAARGRCMLPPLSRLPDLTGRTVLVVQEEGLGDTLQFMRYLPLLAARGARVVVAVPPELSRVMQSIAGVADVPDGSAPVPQHDFYCTFNGLPRAFETTLASIPCDVPYLAAEPGLVQAWARRLSATDGLRVGLVWAGQARPWLPGFTNLDRRRSTTLATLAPLAEIPGIRFISLQKGPAAAEPHTFPMLDLMDDVGDFADTAAIVANLDLVISVDTSVVHLTGAMGKPVFLLDRYDNCWRWLSGREDSPWYPSLRIFRQQRSGEWEPVIARVATALRGWPQAS
jgi:Flp pilus assembly protein TadD